MFKSIWSQIPSGYRLRGSRPRCRAGLWRSVKTRRWLHGNIKQCHGSSPGFARHWFGLVYLQALLCCPYWPYLLGSGNPLDLASGLLSLPRATGTNIVPRKGVLYFAFRSERLEDLEGMKKNGSFEDWLNTSSGVRSKGRDEMDSSGESVPAWRKACPGALGTCWQLSLKLLLPLTSQVDTVCKNPPNPSRSETSRVGGTAAQWSQSQCCLLDLSATPTQSCRFSVLEV